MTDKLNPIGLVALDLDGTTLNKEGKLGERTKQAFLDAMAQGVHIVIATGRAVTVLPEDLLNMEGIAYAITSNGSKITDLRTKEVIYTNFMDGDVADTVIDFLSTLDLHYECFTGDHAYMDDWFDSEEKLMAYGIPETSMKYVTSTRIPVPNLLGFMREHKDAIENINVNFKDFDYKAEMWKEFEKIEGITVTSSLKRNIELGGATTSKATAMVELGRMLGVTPDRIMACGDSHNDMQMLQAAGVAIAVANATDDIKAIADYIAPDNDHDGVGVAIEKFALGRDVE